MIITHIQYPYVFTDTGARISVEDINTTPKVGGRLISSENDKYDMQMTSDNSDCVNGVCPIK